MDQLTTNIDEMPDEIDFRKGVRGLHHIPADAKILVSAAVEQEVWDYFIALAEERGVSLSELLAEVLKHEAEAHRVLK